jgi:hypothetical protein
MKLRALTIALLSCGFVGATAWGAAGSSAFQKPAERTACPWSTCSNDARWLRSVLRRAGIAEVGSTGTALTTPFSAQGHKGEHYFWVTPGMNLARPFTLRYRVRTTAVFGDGVRIVWRAQAMRVWIEPVPSRALAKRVIGASLAVHRR